MNKIKYQVQIPTIQFGYIMAEFEGSDPLEAIELHGEMLVKYQGGDGLTDKELGLIIQNMCLGKTTPDGTNLWSKATLTQKAEINRLKRALDRIKRKGEESDINYGGPESEREYQNLKENEN